jgi:hypothetical protein
VLDRLFRRRRDVREQAPAVEDALDATDATVPGQSGGGIGSPHATPGYRAASGAAELPPEAVEGPPAAEDDEITGEGHAGPAGTPGYGTAGHEGRGAAGTGEE